MEKRLGLQLVTYGERPGRDWSDIWELIRAYDRHGVDALYVADHLGFGPDLSDYSRPGLGGRAGGRQPTGPDGDWLEPLTVLASAASITTRIRLRTSILLAALRTPVSLAKTAATIDALSGGRLDLGVGVGWQRAEFDAAGVAFDGRGAALDRSLEICSRLWRDPVVDYDEPPYLLSSFHSMPKPTHAAGVPLWIGGRSNDAVMQRLARYGAGWIPWGYEPAQLGPAIESMRAAMRRMGRDPAEMRVAAGVPQRSGELEVGRLEEDVRSMQQLGVTDFHVPFVFRDGLAELNEQLPLLVAAFREATRVDANPHTTASGAGVDGTAPARPSSEHPVK